MLEVVNEDIFVTKGDTGTVFISPKNEDGAPYYLSHGELIRLFIRLIPDRPPVIEKELHKEEQNEDGSFCIYFSSSDTDIPRASYMYEATTAQSQEAYLKKYEALTKRYETAAVELERLQNLRTLRSQKDKSMALYIRTLKKQPEVLQEWNDTIWTVVVVKAIVHRNGEITFVFYNGTEISVGA